MYFSFNKLIFRENHMEKIISKPHPKVHKVQSNFQIDERLNQVLYRHLEPIIVTQHVNSDVQHTHSKFIQTLGKLFMLCFSEC